MTSHVKGFFLVSIGLGVFVCTTFFIYCAFIGAEIQVARYKEFRGALSRTMGGDYERREFIEPTPVPERYAVYMDALDEEGRANVEAEAEIQAELTIQRERKQNRK